MSTQEMDYFNQKPDLEMKAFYQTRAMKLAGDVKAGIAPPPVNTAWVAPDEKDQEEE